MLKGTMRTVHLEETKQTTSLISPVLGRKAVGTVVVAPKPFTGSPSVCVQAGCGSSWIDARVAAWR